MEKQELIELLNDELAEMDSEQAIRLCRALSGVERFYAGDSSKVASWLQKPNLNLGGSSPRDLIVKGRSDRLCLFLERIAD